MVDDATDITQLGADGEGFAQSVAHAVGDEELHDWAASKHIKDDNLHTSYRAIRALDPQPVEEFPWDSVMQSIGLSEDQWQKISLNPSDAELSKIRAVRVKKHRPKRPGRRGA